MTDAMSMADRFASVRHQIGDAARRARRDPQTITVVTATKTFPPTTVAAVVAAGLADVGENYVQEAREKRSATSVPARWHLIGGLQRNKVRVAVAVFDRIHTIDSLELASAVDAESRSAGRRLPVLVQVNVTGDAAKRGVLPGAAAALVEGIARLPGLALDGLMTIGRQGAAPATRAGFSALRELRDDLVHRCGVELPHLSMGMSDDFEIAIEEGATLVRLGQVLLGTRGARPWREDA